ncbi:hypothetical protein [Klebsiella variicola]|mgnify:CR=1 FL=1|uniref:hypothetical protein n=1 Tax=Klebsiella variicola TaxID=244366 RepID=UPI000E2C5EE0|nr:hypothetical protein [Klebsiella variicola]MCP3436542.1 hypothetical protein [Klebsiella variicola]MDM7171289.1 hypothetical protein [Klebsiella variicola]SXG07378.1 Uncharacterised protein [Klebsiella variicola]
MIKLYIFNYSDTAGTREEIKTWIENEGKISNWRYDLPNCFYLVANATAYELSTSFNEYNGKKGRHLIAEVTDNREGLLTKQSWAFMRRKRYDKAKLTANDLIYKDEYVDTAESVSDDPRVIFSDSKRLNRKEKYEVLHFLNALTAKGKGEELSKTTRRICEWMIHEHLPADIQNTKKVRVWIAENYEALSKDYPFDE